MTSPLVLFFRGDYFLRGQRKNKRYVSYSATLGEVCTNYTCSLQKVRRTYKFKYVYSLICPPKVGQKNILGAYQTGVFNLSYLLLPLRENKHILHQVKYNQVYGCAKSGSLYDAK